jgi:hypothetical protein
MVKPALIGKNRSETIYEASFFPNSLGFLYFAIKRKILTEMQKNSIFQKQ